MLCAFARSLAHLTWLLPLLLAGCRSPYHADRGALFGGLTGAGVGAIVGDALGDTGAGTVIGAGVGAMTGAAVGSSLDEIEARNRAQIAAQLGREIQASAVTNEDVIAMTDAGVSETLIVTHVEHNGVANSPSPADLIYLKEHGVTDNVIQAMQSPPKPVVVPASPPPPTTIIEEHHYGSPPWRGFGYHHHGHGFHHGRRGPRTHWGVSISH